MPTIYLRCIDAKTDNECWVVCAKDDPGAVVFHSGQIQTASENNDKATDIPMDDCALTINCGREVHGFTFQH